VGQRLLSFWIDSMTGDHGVIDVWAERDFVEGGEEAKVEEGVVYDHAALLHLSYEPCKENHTHIKIAAPIVHRNRINRTLSTRDGETRKGVCLGMGLNVEEDWTFVVEDSCCFFAAGTDDSVGLRLNFFGGVISEEFLYVLAEPKAIVRSLCG
jgi:hypothetical protein